MQRIRPAFVMDVLCVVSLAEVWANERIAYYLHHDPAFPGTYISKSAQNYPEFLLFRAVMIAGPTIMALNWLSHLIWAVRTTPGLETRVAHSIVAALGVIASLFLMVSTAAIDTG